MKTSRVFLQWTELHGIVHFGEVQGKAVEGLTRVVRAEAVSDLKTAQMFRVGVVEQQLQSRNCTGAQDDFVAFVQLMLELIRRFATS